MSSAPPHRRSSHEALFGGATIHFTMTTRTNVGFDIEGASRRLLKLDVAESAAWPSESRVRVTPRLRPIDRGIGQFIKLRSEQGRLGGDTSLLDLLQFALRHPVLMARVLVRGKRRGDENIDWERLEQEVLDAASIVHDAQKVSGVERDADKHYFGGKSRVNDDFVRLLLRNSAHTLLIPADGKHPEREVRVVAEPRLLLHRSGVVQLTIAFPIPGDLTANQLVRLSRSDQARVIRSEVPEPFLVWKHEDAMPGVWTKQLDAGARRRLIDWDEPLSVAVLLDNTLQSVGLRFRRVLPTEWLTYATVMTERGACCKDAATWRRQHAADLARVITRYPSAGEIDHGAMIGQDFSIRNDTSFYLTLASATHIEWERPNAGGIGDLSTVLIVEYALLHYWRLRALEWKVQAFDLGPGLENNYRDFIALAADMRHGDVRYGSARDITQHLLTELGGFELFASIEKSLGLLAQARDTRTARQDARRSFRLTWIATAVAVLLAIPAANAATLPVANWLMSVDSASPVHDAATWAATQLTEGGPGPTVILAAIVMLPFILGLLRVVLRFALRLRVGGGRRGWTPKAAVISTFYEDGGEGTETETSS